MNITTDKKTARTRDLNGYLSVADNPISKAGVFEYLGSEIAGHDLPPDEIFHVFRPPEELARQETIDSFKLMPFIDEHDILGDAGMAPEQKGIQGYIGEQVRFDPPYLRGNLQIPSRAAQRLIDAGKVELSPAYRCRYDAEKGVYDGQDYQFVQRDITANHLALVKEGRTGPDVAVQDGRSVTLDTRGLFPMEFTPEQIEQIKALILEALAAQAAADKAAQDEEKPAEDETAEVEDLEAGETVTPAQADAAEETLNAAEEAGQALIEAAEALEEVEAAAAEVAEAPTEDSKAKLDAARKRLKVAQDSVKALRAKQAPSMDSLRAEIAEVRRLAAKKREAEPAMTADAMVKMIADRDELARKVSPFIGSFDHTSMTADGVAEYATKKIGIKGGRVALDAWLHGRKPESERVVSQDHRVTGDSIDSLWGAK